MRQALLHSAGANATHGLRRSNADKRRAVLLLLHDEEWGAWSDREIARQCAVGHPLVARLRAEHLEVLPDSAPRTVSRGGTIYPMRPRGSNQQAETSPPVLADEPAPAEPQAEAEPSPEPTNVVPIAPRLPQLPAP